MDKKMKNLGVSLWLVCVVGLMVVGCTDDADNDNRLPDGKYPMTFTATVDGLTATRATTDNTWTGNEEVAIQIGSDGEPKKYIAAFGGSLTVESDKEPFYWTNRTMSVSAWYSSSYATTKPTTFSVQTDQSGDGYQTSDFLYAAPQTLTFQSGGNSSKLTFKHLPTKVVVNLKNESSNATVTADEIAGATVSFVNQATTSGEIADGGTVAQVTPSNVTIIPNVLSSAASGYQKSVQALLVPQQMQGNQFIKVSISTSGVEREYYYTPTGTDDANLTGGQQYTYNLTVKKEGLQVQFVSASWTDSADDGDATSATFKIHLADFTAPTNTLNYKVTDATGTPLTADNGVYTTDKEISLSLSTADNYLLKKYSVQVTSGICKQRLSYSADTRTYTCTFYDIHSDLRLQTPSVETIAASSLTSASPQIGDYYYSDGSWSAGAIRDNSKTCIGIVFKVGNDGGNDALNNYGKFLTGGDIHGYVVALQDALTTAGSWGKRGTETPIGNVDNANVTAYTGYSDTKTIIDTYSNGTDWSNYQAFSSVVTYRSSVAAPDLSSGWYLPSLAQLSDVQSAINSISTSLTTAGGSAFKTDNNGRYWTSSEFTNQGLDAWYIEMGSGTKAAYSKGEIYLRPCYVRVILTF